ncbi:MAG TPA: cyclodeaminase/cyclohydrolase family protein [Gemmatimonadales bacterium]|jgi:formiminotetrahydrofolate cyclodeaminase|nr:cyclodeaminase/cyclohydrolase family protein [Gemmatimonadales bacterium]
MDDIEILGTESSVLQWSDAVAAPNATPAGGSVAALASALAASLVAMVAGLTTRREKYAAVHAYAEEILTRAEALRLDLLDLARHDAIVVAEFMDALSLPQSTEFERTAREAARRAALLEAARVQLELLDQAAEVASLAEAMVGSGVATAIGDAATASFLAAAASRSAYWSIRSNLRSINEPEETRPLIESAVVTLDRVEAAEIRVRQVLDERVG